MTVTAKIIADSISNEGIRLITYELYYPRIIHSEFMTHRVFSRNASSSRAIPILRSIMAVLKNSAAPVAWGSNIPGMQAGAELTGWRLAVVKAAWYGLGYVAAGFAWVAMKAGAHKQIVNRMLEPWSHIKVVVTSTYWDNFFALRDHEDADPTIRALAVAMAEARGASRPKLLAPGEWHTPYVSDEEKTELKATMSGTTSGPSDKEFDRLINQMSSSRNARVSYNTHDGKKPTLKADLKLYDQLAGGSPVHASPLEHQATPDHINHLTGRWVNEHLHGNLVGFIQFRKTVDGEAVMEDFG